MKERQEVNDKSLLFEQLKSQLIVSCQAENGAPLDSPEGVLLLARSVLLGGASAIRSCGLEKLALLKSELDVPIIGLTKSKFEDGSVRITGSFEEFAQLDQLGIDVIALDGTFRTRDGLSGPDFIKEAKRRYPHRLIMADISTFEEAIACKEAGADCVSTTLSGYTPHTVHIPHEGPNYELLSKLASAMPAYPVIAEGRFNTPQDAARAIALGAWSVVVGTAITRPHTITSWFVDAIAKVHPGIMFGTDGWRARIDEEINETTVGIVAQAFSDYVGRQELKDPCIAIGYDGRTKSDVFASVFAEVLAKNGIRVLLSDMVCPTPFLSLYTREKNCFAGVMITASHNPAVDNGIKFKTGTGRPFTTEATKEVEALLGNRQIPAAAGWESLVNSCDFKSLYGQYISDKIDFGLIRNAGLKLLADSMYGAGQNLIQDLLKEHGILSETVCSPSRNDFGGRMPEPIEKNLEPLLSGLRQGDYSFGVATDGDADRMGVCMDGGAWLSAQETIALLVDYVKRVRKSPGGIVKTSSVTDKVRLLGEQFGAEVFEVQVGFKYIADIMETHEIAFGGEESGGFGYGFHLPERDGIFSSLILLEMLAASGYNKLSEYVMERRKVWGEICYDRIDYSYEKSDKNELLPKLYANAPENFGSFRVNKIESFNSSRGVINGLKFIFEGHCRWLLIRSSETEKTIRFYAEGQSIEEARDLLQLGLAALGIR